MIANIDSIKLLPDKDRIKALEKILSDFEAGAVEDHKKIENLKDEAESMRLEIRELRKEKVTIAAELEAANDKAEAWKKAAGEFEAKIQIKDESIATLINEAVKRYETSLLNRVMHGKS